MAADDVIYKFHKVLRKLGTPIPPDRDPKISIALRPQLCTVRDEINLEKKAIIIIRREALKRLIENDYKRYIKELGKYDMALIRSQT